MEEKGINGQNAELGVARPYWSRRSFSLVILSVIVFSKNPVVKNSTNQHYSWPVQSHQFPFHRKRQAKNKSWQILSPKKVIN